MQFREWQWRHVLMLWLGVALVATGVVAWHTYVDPPQGFFWLIPHDLGLILRGLLELTRRDPVLWIGSFWLPIAAGLTTVSWLVVRRRAPRGRAPVESRPAGA